MKQKYKFVKKKFSKKIIYANKAFREFSKNMYKVINFRKS